jgi:hypothetical protein
LVLHERVVAMLDLVFLFAGRAPFIDLRFKKEEEDGGRGSNK